MVWLRRWFAAVWLWCIRLRAAALVVLAGAVATAVSQLHVLPPMLCFALLVAGLALLGGGIALGVHRVTAALDRNRPKNGVPASGARSAHVASSAMARVGHRA